VVVCVCVCVCEREREREREREGERESFQYMYGKCRRKNECVFESVSVVCASGRSQGREEARQEMKNDDGRSRDSTQGGAQSCYRD
jgi:hypothetical protein